MKHKKYNIVSYLNDKKKVINAKIISVSDNSCCVEFLREFGIFMLEDMYILKTKNGKIVCKLENQVTLVKNTRLEKLERIINEKE
jgi:hypothetical protein